MSVDEKTDALPGGEGVAHNTKSALAAQVVTTVFAAALTVFLVRALGPADYGVLALAVGIGALIEMPSDFGVSASTARFVAERRSDRSAVVSLVSAALRLKLVISGVVAAGLILAAGPLARGFDEPLLAVLLPVVAVALVGQSFLLLYANVFAALGRTRLYVRLVAGKGLVETSLSVALVLLGAGATGAMAGRAAGFMVAGIAGTLACRRLLGRSSAAPARSALGRPSILHYAGALVVVDGAMTLFTNVDVLLLGAMLGATAVSVFEAPFRLTVPLAYLAQAVATGLAPRLASATFDGASAFAIALRHLLVVQAAVAAAIFAWADELVRLVLGVEYAESADVLRGLTPFILLSGIAPLVASAANYLGRARRRVPVALAAVALNIAIDVALIPGHGAVAAAWGTSAAYVLYVPAHVWICRQALDFSLRDLAVTFARAVAAGAAMVAVVRSMPEIAPHVDPFIEVMAGMTSFASVLALTGELTRADLVTARTIRRRLSRAGA